VVDCANGATYRVAPAVFRELGAEVISIHDRPDGLNINEQCGSTHPQSLIAAVQAHQADLGLAFDGDGDRVIMVSDQGELIDGDRILYVLAKARLANGGLEGGVVGTVMSNFGLEQAFAELGIAFERAAVGDRHVCMSVWLSKVGCWAAKPRGIFFAWTDQARVVALSVACRWWKWWRAAVSPFQSWRLA